MSGATGAAPIEPEERLRVTASLAGIASGASEVGVAVEVDFDDVCEIPAPARFRSRSR